MADEQNKKCPKCKCWRTEVEFKKQTARGWRILKTCCICRERNNKAIEKTKCEHKRRRSRCKECGGASLCEHKRIRSTCKDCDGSQICEHKRRRSSCKDCDGGSICEHKRIRSQCKYCDGASICEHKRIRSKCKDCDPNGYLMVLVRSRTWDILKNNKDKKTMEYLCCSTDELRKHLEDQFTEGMTWENQGKWHIDHIIPLKYGNPTLDEIIERLHYTNLQPLWAEDNIAKGNRFIG